MEPHDVAFVEAERINILSSITPIEEKKIPNSLFATCMEMMGDVLESIGDFGYSPKQHAQGKNFEADNKTYNRKMKLKREKYGYEEQDGVYLSIETKQDHWLSRKSKGPFCVCRIKAISIALLKLQLLSRIHTCLCRIQTRWLDFILKFFCRKSRHSLEREMLSWLPVMVWIPMVSKENDSLSTEMISISACLYCPKIYALLWRNCTWPKAKAL